MAYTRDRIIKEILLLLGSGMVDVELEPDHLNLAIDMALDRYRQRSGNALEESFVFLTLQPEVSNYRLPDEVQEVMEVLRRTMSGTGGGGAAIDPFSAAMINNIYMLQNPSSGGGGSLSAYDAAAQYIELAGRMFGRDVQFTWNASTKTILFHRRFTGSEEIALHVFNTKPEETIFADPYARPWIRDYALAKSKIMLGEAYAKFQSLAGPQGGVTLKGDALKAEGAAELERLETEAAQFLDSHQGMPFIIG